MLLIQTKLKLLLEFQKIVTSFEAFRKTNVQKF